MTVPVVTVSAAGIQKPDFEEVRSWVESQFRAIYGDDIYTAPDSQDGALIAIFAQAIHDSNATAVAIFNSRSPVSAQGEGLSSLVKINGIRRHIASSSTAQVRLIGEAGAIITNGAASDLQGNRWNLPPSITIPSSGEITVTATASVAGAIAAGPNTINSILTPTRGWQSVTNPASAVVGLPVETDAQLRRRREASVALPARSLLDGMAGAILALPNVSACRVYENDQIVSDENGIPRNSIAIVVKGGTPSAIAEVIYAKKGAGVATYGSLSVEVPDLYGVMRTIRFFRPLPIGVAWRVPITKLPGFTTEIAVAMQQAIVDYTATLGIGAIIDRAGAYPALLAAANGTCRIGTVLCSYATDLGVMRDQDLRVAFNQEPVTALNQVQILAV